MYLCSKVMVILGAFCETTQLFQDCFRQVFTIYCAWEGLHAACSNHHHFGRFHFIDPSHRLQRACANIAHTNNFFDGALTNPNAASAHAYGR